MANLTTLDPIVGQLVDSFVYLVCGTVNELTLETAAGDSLPVKVNGDRVNLSQTLGEVTGNFNVRVTLDDVGSVLEVVDVSDGGPVDNVGAVELQDTVEVGALGAVHLLGVVHAVGD